MSVQTSDLASVDRRSFSAPELGALVAVFTAHFVSHFYYLVLPPLFPLLRDRTGLGFIELGLGCRPKVATVFDIETVLDEGAVARAYNLPAGDGDAIKATVGDGFPKAAFHRIVAIAAATLTYDIDSKNWSVLEIASVHAGVFNETDLLRKFAALTKSTMPVFVDYNSLGFDLPVILARALLHRIRIPHIMTYGFDA